MGEGCNCPCLPRCPFFEDTVGAMPATAKMYRDRYCLAIYTRCARFLVFRKAGRENVPRNLHPNQVRRAQYLIDHLIRGRAA